MRDDTDREGKETSIYLRHDVAEALDERSRLLDRSRSWLIDNMLVDGLGLAGQRAVARMTQAGYREYTRLDQLYQRGAFGTEAVHNVCLHEFAHVWLYCLQQLGAVSMPEHDLRCHGWAYRGLLAQLISDYPYRDRDPLAAPVPVPEAVSA